MEGENRWIIYFIWFDVVLISFECDEKYAGTFWDEGDKTITKDLFVINKNIFGMWLIAVTNLNVYLDLSFHFYL